MLMKPVEISYGSDPEGFFSRDGRIIGSERIIPKQGLFHKDVKYVIRDGIQFELNPPAAYTVGGLGRHLTEAFRTLNTTLLNQPGVRYNWQGLVEVSRDEMDCLSEDSRQFGCKPSFNFYEERPITVDPKVYLKRSAGGHFHLGLNGSPIYQRYGGTTLSDHRVRMVPLLDVFVGTVGVLFDRDPGQKERRENYGRAGEYRLPDHGLEYRTTSNFWICNYTMMNIMLGMVDIAVAVLANTINSPVNLEGELIDVVDIGDVVRAIDENDYDLARKNFEVLVPFLARHLPEHGFIVNPKTIHKILVFADGVKNDGLDSFFITEPQHHWADGKQVGVIEYLERLF